MKSCDNCKYRDGRFCGYFSDIWLILPEEHCCIEWEEAQ